MNTWRTHFLEEKTENLFFTLLLKSRKWAQLQPLCTYSPLFDPVRSAAYSVVGTQVCSKTVLGALVAMWVAVRMHCYLVTDDCASMGRRRAELSGETESVRFRASDIQACHSTPAITVELTSSRHGGGGRRLFILHLCIDSKC